MKPLRTPAEAGSLVVRTDFAHPDAWTAIQAEMRAGEFPADVQCVDDRDYDGVSPEQAVALLAEPEAQRTLFLVDAAACESPDHPILVLDPAGVDPSFRVVATELWGVQCNLGLANLDWEDFVDNLDPDGVFRKFPE